MNAYIVLSAVGRDRTGFIRQFSQVIHQAGGNIELQRSVQAASEYALILLFTVPSPSARSVMDQLNGMRGEDLFVNARPALSRKEDRPKNARSTRLTASGADQPGIIDAVTLLLFDHGVNVESMDFGVEGAPWTGEPLFRMEALLAVPEGCDEQVLHQALRDLEDQYNFDILLTPI